MSEKTGHETGNSSLHKAFENHVGVVKTGLNGLSGGNVVDHNRNGTFAYGAVVKLTVNSREKIEISFVLPYGKPPTVRRRFRIRGRSFRRSPKARRAKIIAEEIKA